MDMFNITPIFEISNGSDVLSTGDGVFSELREVIGFICYFVKAFGIIGNTLTIVYIWSSTKWHTPTYMVIAELALADLSVLVAETVRELIVDYKNSIFENCLHFKFIVLAVVMTTSHASSAHVVFLSGVQYRKLTRPLEFRIHWTSRKTVLYSVLLWLISIVVASVYSITNYLYERRDDAQVCKHLQLGMRIYFAVVPLAFLVTFHVLKIRGLRTSTAMIQCRALHKMTKMVKIIIAMYVVTMTPVFCMYVISDVFTGIWLQYFLPFGIMFVCLNYASNPLIYFLFSPALRDFVSKYLTIFLRLKSLFVDTK